MVSCVRMWRGLGEGNWASLLICQADSYVRITLSWLYDSDYGMYTITRELKGLRAQLGGAREKVQEDPQGLWRQALQT
jgi:hypothetical protein